MTMNTLTKSYYQMRFLIPRSVQLRMRQCLVRYQQCTCMNNWPIDHHSSSVRPPWTRWPGNKQFAVVLTHDVETADGVMRCFPLMSMEQKMGFRSSFNFVPERYITPPQIRKLLLTAGFEVGVHGLRHDGKLYHSKKIFMERAAKINEYLAAWNATGFRSPSMHHNLKWLHALNIKYDLSTFDSDPFEPDNRGLRTIFPQWINNEDRSRGYVEMPYTLPQDSTLYFLLNNTDITIWKHKLDWVAEHGGMVLINTHPDYMGFPSSRSKHPHYPAAHYQKLLEYLRSKYAGAYWHALPHEMATFAEKAYQMG